jgi:hypothetical protein
MPGANGAAGGQDNWALTLAFGFYEAFVFSVADSEQRSAPVPDVK